MNDGEWSLILTYLLEQGEQRAVYELRCLAEEGYRDRAERLERALRRVAATKRKRDREGA